MQISLELRVFVAVWEIPAPLFCERNRGSLDLVCLFKTSDKGFDTTGLRVIERRKVI